MHKRNGFAPIEVILIVVVLAVVGYLGYRVYDSNQSDNNQANNSETTQTAPTPVTKAIAFGDSGNGSDEQKAIAALIEQEEFDAVVHTGDVAYGQGTKQQFLEKHDQIYSSKIKDSLWPSPGNHDYQTDQAQPYLDYFDLPKVALNEADHERYYSFDINDVHFIALDTNTPLEEISDQRNDDMADWLEQDLASVAEDKVIIAFFHHPPVSTGKYDPNEGVRDKLVPLFEQYNIDLVLAGHEHNYQRTCPLLFSDNTPICDQSGVAYIITGGGGYRLYEIKQPLPEHFEYAESIFNYVRFTVDGSGISGEAVNIDGQVVDTFSIAR